MDTSTTEHLIVEAVKLTGDTDKADTKNIMDCLNATAQGRAIPGREIKLIYVTVQVNPEIKQAISLIALQPEKIAKSKTFMSVLSKLAQNSKLREGCLFLDWARFILPL